MTTLDYKSKDVLSERLDEVFKKFTEKTKSECNTSDLKRAVAALVGLVSTNPSFIKQKLMNLEKIMFNDKVGFDVKRPTLEELEVLLSHWYELAKLAYEPETDIILSNLKDLGYVCINHYQSKEPGVVSYYLGFSPEKKEFLIGVKGTGTIEDLLTDCLAAAVPYKAEPLWPFAPNPGTDSVGGSVREISAHEGMLSAALRLKEAIDPLLEHCYIPLGYSVRIVGHSLGAGTSSLLALLLRTKYKELHLRGKLHAYCFATPPVMDFESAVSSKEFITTIANRNDCVVRLSMANAEVLVRTLEKLIPRMKKEGLDNTGGFMKTICGGKEIDDETFEAFVHVVEDAQASVDVSNLENLSVPGKIIALYGTLDEVPDNDDDIEAKVVVKATDILCNNPMLRFIDINSRMVSDHLLDLPGGYKESLQACIKSMQST